MAYLTPDKIYTLSTPSGVRFKVNQKLIPDTAVATKYVASWCQEGWPMKPCCKLGVNNSGTPLGITIHNTSKLNSKISDDDAEVYTLATYPNCNMGGVVVHFYVYKSSIWQNLSVTEQGWHASDGSGRYVKTHNGTKYIGGNIDTIAIEVVGNDKETEDTAAKLCANLCKRFSFTPSKDIYTHNYFNHRQGDKIIPGAAKNCPYYILPHWSDFLKSVESYMAPPSYVVTGTKTVKSDKLNETKGMLIANGFSVSVK